MSYISIVGRKSLLNELLFKGSSVSPVPKIVGLAEFLISTIPIIIKSFELLFNMYFKITNLTLLLTIKIYIFTSYSKLKLSHNKKKKF